MFCLRISVPPTLEHLPVIQLISNCLTFIGVLFYCWFTLHDFFFHFRLLNGYFLLSFLHANNVHFLSRTSIDLVGLNNPPQLPRFDCTNRHFLQTFMILKSAHHGAQTILLIADKTANLRMGSIKLLSVERYVEIRID